MNRGMNTAVSVGAVGHHSVGTQHVAVAPRSASTKLCQSVSYTCRRNSIYSQTISRSKQNRTRDVTTMGLFGLGVPELVVVGGVAALLFGPSKLPEIGRGLGKTVKSFQEAANEFKDELNAAATEGNEGEATPPPAATTPPPETPKAEETPKSE